jgi:hypothetical protein
MGKPIHDAGLVVKRALVKASPSRKAGRSWSMRSASRSVRITSRDLGVIFTDRNSDHPLFARIGTERYEKGPRYHTNVHHPERTGWIDRTLQAAMPDAVDDYAREQTDIILRRYGF